MELGLTTFAELTPDPRTGHIQTPEQRMKDLLEEVELADQVGLDVFGLGEHHRPDFVASAPAVALAAAAARTKTIRLSSAVTVLSSEDPVRVFQQFSTLDLISGGRAEIWAGRGSFTESFPLFGQDLDDYDELYSEKLDLLLQLREPGPTTWSGRHRAPVPGIEVHPRPVQDPLPVWVAVGGTPQSVVRAAVLGLPLVIAIIGGQPERFVPLVDLYRRAAAEVGHDPSTLPIAINTHAFLDRDAHAAAEQFWPSYGAMMSKIGMERGWPPMSRGQYDEMRAPRGALLVGDPQRAVEKILFQHELFGHQRYLAQFSVGSMPHAAVMKAIELFGTEVAPAVREEVKRREAVPA